MDDGGRIGGLQALFLLIGGTAVYVAKLDADARAVGGAVVAALIATGALGAVGWLERYAWRRRREDREAEKRRRQHAAIAHLDFEDPLTPR